MFYGKTLFFMILIELINTTPQLNFHFTDPISTNENDDQLQHDCLQWTSSYGFHSVIYYCMSESSLKFNIQKNDLFPSFTFADLSKQNITSQQLYLWSAPIDLIEQYQFYLNELSLSTKYFYNCTLPRFGPMCQYEFDYRDDNDLPVYDIESILSATESFSPTNLTCYMHLVCNRSSILECLDWTEICDGYINCLNGGIDEKHCWELEINDCKHDEYRCHNGQCIPWRYVHDNTGFECVDKTDEYPKYDSGIPFMSALDYDDTTCTYTFLSSSCFKHRHFLLAKRLFSMKENNVSNDCWSAFICALQMFDGYCPNSNNLDENIRIVEEMCPVILKIPSVPDLFGDIHFVYVKNNLQNLTNDKYWDFYLCPKSSLNSKVSFNNTTCYYHMQWMLDQWSQSSEQEFFGYQKEMLHKYDLMINYSFVICNRRDMYQCINSSKCISIYRLMDSVNDCLYADDEHENIINNTALQELFKRKTFKCLGRDKRYVLLLGFRQLGCSCSGSRDEICADDKKLLSHVDFDIISFATTCDGFIDLQIMTIDGRNETDEIECEQWPCNNTYTRCDGIWHCIDGSDELGCDLFLPLNCSLNQHICISSYTNELVCLSIEKTNDGIIDCLGGIDEPKVCRRKDPLDKLNDFRCLNDNSNPCIDSTNICDSSKDCLHGDDEQFCKIENITEEWIDNCQVSSTLDSFDINQFICRSLEVRRFSRRTVLSLKDYSNSNKHLTTNVKSQIRSSSPVIRTFNDNNRRCNRGIDIRVWLDSVKNLTKRICFCPPSYYGDICQYQNQRVKLIPQIFSSTNSHRTLFAVVVSLIDDDDKRIIHSYHQFTYIPTRDCFIKSEFYSTYSTRPKNPTKKYSIHIDFYEKHSLGYRGSLLIPILFPFLPVHRLAVFVSIPSNNDSVTSCSIRQCVHGKCIKYFNNSENAKFCQCNRGWSGRYCDIPHTSMCSLDSVHIGVSVHNRSVCVCPIHKFRPRCLLTNTICQNNQNSTCRNGGQCIPDNEQTQSKNNGFTCLCPKGFYGIECLPAAKQLMLSFGKDIVIPQSIFIHFIAAVEPFGTIRTTMFETIPIDKNTTIIDLLHEFQILLTEFEKKNYYLTAVEKVYNKSGTVVKTINPSDRCRHINEIFNETMIQLPLIRRIKYYHLPCQTYSPDLSCFYDDVNLCLCYDYDQQRLANCFYFNHNMISNCYGFSDCENGAQCFQQMLSCPEKAVCVCPSCFYGLRCQFSTSGFGLSLDGILGYHI